MSLLTLDDLTVRFGGLVAVSQVDCAVEEGQIVSIIGPNGAGKTTVFNAITGIYEPSSGTIRFAGRELRRPPSWRVYVRCALVGVATAIALALVGINADALWRATIKRNYTDPGQRFSYLTALFDIGGYYRGELADEPFPGGRRAVMSPDGAVVLGYAKDRLEAHKLAERLTDMIALDGSDSTLEEQTQLAEPGQPAAPPKWAVLAADRGRVLAEYDSAEAARAALDKLAKVGADSAARRRNFWLGLLGGLVVGVAGTWTIWNRARRTPEVIARAGIARTFQNIRLFANLTVLENVLIGLDREIKGGVLRMALRTPGVRRSERAARSKARDLLDFVGLREDADKLAKNLPYGNQRRLEIARALATGPRLILLDEPAAGMNPTESVALTELVRRIRARGVSVLLIEHHMKVVMGISDRICVLDYGTKIAEGTPHDVRNNPAVIKAYLGSEEIA